MKTSESKNSSESVHFASPSSDQVSDKNFFKSIKGDQDPFFSFGPNQSGLGIIQKKGVQHSGKGNIPKEIRRKLEQAFQTDFSNVQVKENSRKAEELDAVAYTQGNEINFAPGHNPYSSEGQKILGHELVHVLQQRRDKVKPTHEENGYSVSIDPNLEKQADREGQKAANGEPAMTNLNSSTQYGAMLSVQKKSHPIQLWRDVPGQARIESTAPNTRQAWSVFMEAARDAAGGHASSAEGELRARYYNLISQRLRGSFVPINVDAHTTTDFNHHWTGTIRFVFGDQETSLEGGGAAPTTLQNVSGSSNVLESSSSNTTGSSGDVEGGYSQGDEGFSGTVGAGGSGSSTTGLKSTQGDTQTAGSSSQVNQQLNRYSSTIGIEVNLSVTYDMGSSWSDWINPAAYGAWGGGAALLENGSASGICGTVIYYKGSGIVSSDND